MGRTCDQLPLAEALPGIGPHNVVFHNGRGYYYCCMEYSGGLKERVYKCLRPECDVVASMDPGVGSSLVDNKAHSHTADPTYRDKCVLLHTIQQRFLSESVSALLILQEVIAPLLLKESETISAHCETSASCDDEYPSVLCKEEYMTFEETSICELFKDESFVIEENENYNETPIPLLTTKTEIRSPTETAESTLTVQPVKQTYQRTRRTKPVQMALSSEPSTSQSEASLYSCDTVQLEFVDVQQDNFDYYKEGDCLTKYKVEKTVNSKESTIVDDLEASQQKPLIQVRKDLATSFSKKRTKRRTWNEAKLFEAVLAVKKREMGLKKASRVFQVPRSTINRYKKFKISKLQDEMRKPLGRAKVFPAHIEKELVDYCLMMKKTPEGLRAKNLKQLAYSIAEKNQLKHNFSLKKRCAGPNWIRGFFKRYPECRTRKRENVAQELEVSG